MTLLFFILFISISKIYTQFPQQVQNVTAGNNTLTVNPEGGIITYAFNFESINETIEISPGSIIEKNLTGFPVNKNASSLIHQIPSFGSVEVLRVKETTDSGIPCWLFNLDLKKGNLKLFFYKASGSISGTPVKAGSLRFFFSIYHWDFCNNQGKTNETECNDNRGNPYNGTVLDVYFKIESGKELIAINNTNFYLGHTNVSFIDSYNLTYDQISEVSKVEKFEKDWPKFMKYRFNNHTKARFESNTFFNLEIPVEKVEPVSTTTASVGKYSVTQNKQEICLVDKFSNTTIFKLKPIALIISTYDNSSTRLIKFEDHIITLQNVKQVGLLDYFVFSLKAASNSLKYYIEFKVQLFAVGGTIKSYDYIRKTHQGDLKIEFNLVNYDYDDGEKIDIKFELDHEKTIRCVDRTQPLELETNCKYEKSQFLFSNRYITDENEMKKMPKNYPISFTKDKKSTTYSIRLGKSKTSTSWEAFLRPIKDKPIYNEKDQHVSLNHTKFDLLTKGGSISINNVVERQLQKMKIMNISLNKINEIDGDGNVINFKDKSPFSYSSKDEFGILLERTAIQDINVLSLEAKNDLGNEKQVKLQLFSFESPGIIIMSGEEKVPVKAEDIKVDITLTNWKTCVNCPNEKGEGMTASYFDLVVNLIPELNREGEFNSSNKTIRFPNSIMKVPSTYDLDGKIASMPKDYPKFNKNDHTITLRFASTGHDMSIIRYESFIERTYEPESSGSIVLILIILFVLILVIGIIVYCKSYSKKTSSMIEKDNRFQDI